MPLPSVSRKVSELEAHLGTQLVIRTNRKLLLTDAGSASLRRAGACLRIWMSRTRGGPANIAQPRGDLLVTAWIMFGILHVMAVVLAFLAAYAPGSLPVHLVHTGPPLLPLKMRAFLDFAGPRLKASLADIANI